MKLSEMSGKPTTRQMKKVMEDRFGFAIDYNKLTLKRAYRMATAITESLAKLKRTHSIHTLEKNPKYMEMFMVRESLHSWMAENKQRFLAESEMAKSQAILAAKDMVDSIQDMLETISKMQNEQLPALLDTIRDQLSTEQADAFKGSVGPLLQELSGTLQQGRETADTAARQLAGEQVDQDMSMGGGGEGGMGGAPDLGPGMGGGAGAMPGAEGDMGGDTFGATDASAGGSAELGRDVRGESRIRSGHAVNENERVDELSRDTLKSYKSKVGDRIKSFRAQGDDQLTNKKADPYYKKSDLAADGRKRATDRLNGQFHPKTAPYSAK